MLHKVVFILREYEDTDWQMRLTELEADLRRHKITYAFHSIPADETGSILYVSDSAEKCRELAEQGCYVLPCRHDRNQEEVFESGRYLYIAEQMEEMDYESLDMVYRRLAVVPLDILTTKRCKIRETTENDVEAFYDIYQEPTITEYMEDLYADREEEIAYVQEYIRKVYYFYGYGMWTVEEKESGQVIGRAGISWREGFELPELGFVIGVPWQRKGYAYEVCTAILAYAKEELGMKRIQTLIMKGNEKSERLCEKLGFVCGDEVCLEGVVYHQYVKQLSSAPSR